MQVNEVQPGQVVVTDAPTNTKKNVEFGTCIWTTGIKMHPLVGKLAKTLPQGLSAPSSLLSPPLDPSKQAVSVPPSALLQVICTCAKVRVHNWQRACCICALVSDPVDSHPAD